MYYSTDIVLYPRITWLIDGIVEMSTLSFSTVVHSGIVTIVLLINDKD